jgi:integrase
VGRYPHLILHRRRWMVRMIVPADVRPLIGQSVFKISTGETDEHRAVAKAGPIIAGLKDSIRTARATLKKPIETKAAELAAAYQARPPTDPPATQVIILEDIITFVLQQEGHSWADYGRRVREAGYDTYAGLRSLRGGDAAGAKVDAITQPTTPFLKYLDDWKPHAGLKMRPLDQAISTLHEFSDAVKPAIEGLEAKHVQAWIDGLINPDAETGLTAKTVGRKLSELRNYWRYLQSRQIVPEDKLPFANRRVKDPASRRKTKEEKRQRFRPESIVRLWQEAERQDDVELSKVIKIAAYSGARIEGVVQLKTADIRTDPDSHIKFMRMVDKTAAGDRFVPVHPKLGKLIDDAITHADRDGYLIRSDARNKYDERSQPIGKRFGRLKTALGFDGRYVFHSMRKTVASLFQDAGCEETVAADIIGHNKPTMTYGLYGGETRMDLRAKWLAKAIRYPAVKDVHHPEPDRTGTHLRPNARPARPRSISGEVPHDTEH